MYKKIKITKEKISLTLIVILSAVLNFVNLNIEGTANSYYAAAVKSMTKNFKNFFFVSFDPAGFMSIDKPPVGYWFQAISAKIFGFHGWSILLPQALAGVISVVILYHIVKKSFGSEAGLISALFLAVTPVFVAVSRNNTVDNILVLALLLACWAVSIAAEKGKLKYLIISMVLIGIGFNIKMLQAYMIIPAVYVTYLFSTAVSMKKRIGHLIIGTAILVAVSLSWAVIVDLVPAKNRPYVDSSTNNTVMELILGHNGAERLSFGNSKSNFGGGGFGRGGQMPSQFKDGKGSAQSSSQNAQQGMPGNPPSGNGQMSGSQGANSQMGQATQGGNGEMGQPPEGGGQMMQGPGGNGKGMGFGGMGGNSSQLSGTFGGQTEAGLTRLFSKNILSDQVVWFIPLAILGFIAAVIQEKLKFKLDSKRKQALALWFMWFLPVFIYFSFNTGTFHSYYLTMLAPPVAALAGIGVTSMWQMYKEGGRKAWFLPAALIVNGSVQLLMLSYFISSSNIVKELMVILIALCFGSSIVLAALILRKKPEKPTDSGEYTKKRSKTGMILTAAAVIGLLAAPFTGSAAVLTNKLNGSFPAAGLELLSNSGSGDMMMKMTNNIPGNTFGTGTPESGNSKLIQFLEKNKTADQKYLLVVSNSNSAADIIINTGEAVMSIGGFLGNDKSITLDQFKALVKKGEIRYVMTGGQGGGQGGSGSGSDIMGWVQKNGTVVSSSEYGGANTEKTNSGTINKQSSAAQDKSDNTQSRSGSMNDKNKRIMFGGQSFEQLYDLKKYTDSQSR